MNNVVLHLTTIDQDGEIAEKILMVLLVCGTLLHHLPCQTGAPVEDDSADHGQWRSHHGGLQVEPLGCNVLN